MLYKNLNEMVEYIEKHLNTEISYPKLASFLGCSVYTLERVFSLMTGITLKEYIKQRKMSLAAIRLMQGEKVIDVAYDAGYSSAAAFSRKFFEMYQIHPKKVKNKEHHLVFRPVLKFNEIKEESLVRYRIEKTPEKTFYAIREEVPLKFPEVAEKMWKKAREVYPSIFEETPRYAFLDCREKQYYFILSTKKLEGFEPLSLPRSKWLVFEGKSFNGRDIEALFMKAYDEYLGALPLKTPHKYELELYYEDYMEIWIQIDE